MFFPYKITQREPAGSVTVWPDEIVIGPTDIALEPEVMEYVVLTVCVFS